MNQLLFAAALVSGAGPETSAKPFRVQYVQPAVGQSVQVSIDGGAAHTTFGGKLGFTDGQRTWTSVCAAVRKPIVSSQLFVVQAISSTKAGGNVALAGNIVAKHFDGATSAAQCAGLQLAVWEAIEDGGEQPDFASGHFRARASKEAMAYARQYYEAIGLKGEAVYLQTGQGGGSGSGTGSGGGQDQLSSVT